MCSMDTNIYIVSLFFQCLHCYYYMATHLSAPSSIQSEIKMITDLHKQKCLSTHASSSTYTERSIQIKCKKIWSHWMNCRRRREEMRSSVHDLWLPLQMNDTRESTYDNKQQNHYIHSGKHLELKMMMGIFVR